jgi:hypothetical protein
MLATENRQGLLVFVAGQARISALAAVVALVSVSCEDWHASRDSYEK